MTGFVPGATPLPDATGPLSQQQEALIVSGQGTGATPGLGATPVPAAPYDWKDNDMQSQEYVKKYYS